MVSFKRVPILLYHQIEDIPPQRDPGRLSISPRQFEAHMHYLATNNYSCLSLDTLVEVVRNGGDPPHRAFVLTFDDGYRDFLTTANAILLRYGFTATVFMVAGQIGQWSSWTGKDGERSAPLLSWPELRRLCELGTSVGSHTMTHKRLSQIPHEEAVCEIQESKQVLEEGLGKPIRFLSYPYADYDERVRSLVSEAGHEAALGLNKGTQGILNLWRVQCLSTDSPFLFKLKVSGWYELLLWLRHESFVLRGGSAVRRRLRAIQHTLRPTKRGVR
jgi:peptidoglycan/xylan/chitin deacetylase (PgdA/CDA1 family)